MATAGSPDLPTPSATADVLTQYVDAQRRWVDCMRQQGHNLPDPDVKGAVDVSAYLNSKKVSKADAGFRAAQKECSGLKPTVPAELEERPAITAEQLANRQKYAKCMRENGMPQFPDPDPAGEFRPSGQGGEQTEQEALDNEKALQICDPVIDGKPKGTWDPNKKAQG
ncbi:hypothetical protein AB0M02_35980 [Actinoplanes sp. NPDC051861]|uniref:hypothetical protein n=1 Tax=Actinoplanes sp. NPDC051861 TaxID=3155170 RepID=UPI003422883E